MRYAGVQTVVKAFHIHTQHTIEVLLGSALNRSYMRHSGVIYKNVNPLTAEDCIERAPDLRLICDVAGVNCCIPTVTANLFAGCSGVLLAEVENPDPGAVRREL